MESDPRKTSTVSTRCQVLLSRATCAVCGAPSIGRNFDAMTCLSCKAFFRRNAYNEHLIYTCRLSNSCKISIVTRRHCSACRLKKCFQRGMKKELIRSLNAINHATSATVTSRSQQRSSRPMTIGLSSHNDRSSLSKDDWNLLTNIRNAYEQYCVQQFIDSHQRIPLIPPKQPYRSRIKLQRLIDLKYKYLIVISSFIKRILQFDILQLSPETHYYYIKDNFQILLTLNTSELMKSKVLECLPWEHDQLLFESVLTENIIQRIEKISNTFQALLPYDALIMKVFVLILALSSKISPLLKKVEYNSADFDPLPTNFLSCQNYYLTILWKYVIFRLGHHDAVSFLVRFIQNLLRRQTIQADITEIIETREDHGQLVQFMQMTMKF